MGFDSIVFADRAPLAALSCFSRLKSERDAGRKTLLIALVDTEGAEVVEGHGLATVQAPDPIDPGGPRQPWRERLSLTIRRLGVSHVLAPVGLLGAHQAIDYFGVLRAAMSVDKGRDLLFFEEKPACLMPEAVWLRLASLGVRLPPASTLRSPRRYAPFALRMVTGLGVPPIFGPVRERSRLARSLKHSFRDARDWDPLRALGPKMQPVTAPWHEDNSKELFALAKDLGVDAQLGSPTAFRRRMLRHAASALSRSPIERYWLSLPGYEEPEGLGEPY